MNRPVFVLEKAKLQDNLALFESLAEQTGIKWLFTLKAFAEPEGLELIASSFSGFSIGNFNEYGKIAPYNKALHSYAPAFYEDEIETLAQKSTTLSFNSFSQWNKYAKTCAPHCSLGLRINPKLSLNQPSYCDGNSARFGVDYELFLQKYRKLDGLEGLHFHSFCNQDTHALEELLRHISNNYKELLPKLKWLNLGGGQNFTHSNYDVRHFVKLIQNFQSAYPDLTLYFEPASALLHNCGYLECKIMDIIETKPPIAILNTSTETHLLDIAIHKQKPPVRGSLKNGNYCYELSGISCIAGDSMGIYCFDKPLKNGDKIIFENTLAYAIVKQTVFNGIEKAKFKIL